ncbi:MAG: hypothetical protein ABUR63_03040, partial [Verrucomicrobiota bacterium]
MWQTPIAAVVDEHTSDTGQPLLPVVVTVPRQPGTQRASDTSHTRPEVAPPQSASWVHPHCPPAIQLDPASVALQAPAAAGVHSRHLWVAGSQTRPPVQSAVITHCTHCPPPVTSQRGSGSAQSASFAQPVGATHTPAPLVWTPQVWPAGHPLRGAAPHPGWQIPFAPLQTRPELAVPQAPSSAQPHSPVSGRHWGLAPPHRAAFAGVHSVHAPASAPVVWQTGRLGSGQLGAPSAAHGTHTCVVTLQFGVTPPQSASPRHPTQAPPPDAVSQSGRDVGQRDVSAAVQTPHAPLGRHSGAPTPHSVLPVHARQVEVAPSQTGCAAGQAPGLPGAQ